jgi:hypothetical protein
MKNNDHEVLTIVTGTEMQASNGNRKAERAAAVD